MLLRYKPKHEHIKCVPLIPTTPETKKLKIDRPQVQLLPGVNEVTDNEWEVMKLHLSREIKNGDISVIEKEVAKSKTNPSGGKAHNLKNMPAKDAIILVGECVNPDTLAKWHKEETRDEIRLAIVEKMKELKIDIPKFIPGLAGDDDENSESGDGGKNLDDMTVEELKTYAAEKNITVSGNKAEIIAAIKAAEAK